MATPAGELSVEIIARLDKFDAAMKAMEAKAGRAGSTAGTAAGTNLVASMAQRLEGQLRGAFTGIGGRISSEIANSLKSAEGDTALAESFGSLFDSIPIVNIAYRLGRKVKNAISESLSGDQTEAQFEEGRADVGTRGRVVEAKMKEEAQIAAYLLSIENGKKDALKAQLEIEAQMVAKEKERLTLAGVYDKETLERQKEKGRAVQRERDLYAQLVDIREKELDRGEAARDPAKTDAERASRRKVVELELAEIYRKSREDVLKIINKEEEARQRIAETEAEAAAEAAKNAAAQAEAIAEATSSAERDYSSMAIGSSQTALGSFKFEAYPPTLQKTIQERTMKAVEKLATQRTETAGIT